MATYGTGFDEFGAGDTATQATGVLTVQQATNTTSVLTDIGGGDLVCRHTITGDGVSLVIKDGFSTSGPCEAVTKHTLTTTSDQNGQIGPALVHADGRCYAWRANTAAPATAWRLAQFSSTGSVSASIGTAATFSEPAAGTAFWILIGRDGSGNIYGSLWLDGESRPGSPMASAANSTLTDVVPGYTTKDSSDDPIDFHWFGAATAGDTAPESAGGGGGTANLLAGKLGGLFRGKLG